jgi:catechol 2,3-dioxygenase-like lactoylglutathione lyase family enzyme
MTHSKKSSVRAHGSIYDLSCASVEASVDWYSKMLGTSPRQRSKNKGVEFTVPTSLGKIRIRLCQANSESLEAGSINLILTTQQFVEIRDRAEIAGIDFPQASESPIDIVNEYFDPDGNSFWLVCRDEDFPEMNGLPNFEGDFDACTDKDGNLDVDLLIKTAVPIPPLQRPKDMTPEMARVEYERWK